MLLRVNVGKHINGRSLFKADVGGDWYNCRQDTVRALRGCCVGLPAGPSEISFDLGFQPDQEARVPGTVPLPPGAISSQGKGQRAVGGAALSVTSGL